MNSSLHVGLYTTGHFEKMSAPVRPMAGAFATGHLIDVYYAFRKIAYLETVVLAPTRAGAGIYSKFSL
jgi:hypothetical protein